MIIFLLSSDIAQKPRTIAFVGMRWVIPQIVINAEPIYNRIVLIIDRYLLVSLCRVYLIRVRLASAI